MSIQFKERKSGKIITEHPPAEILLKFLYGTSVGAHTLLKLARKKSVSERYGRKMARPASKKKIKKFIEKYDIAISEAQKKVSEFKSFNDFFIRKLKPEARTIQEDVVSPADSRLLVFENLESLQEFFIKSRKFNLQKFLCDPELASNYKDGSMMIARLAPNDYHRYHFPVDGKVVEYKEISGTYYSVSPHALQKNFNRVFTENKRSICKYQSDLLGEILLIPVGATMVGSIISTSQVGQKYKKGDEMGYFAFGGSTIVCLFQKQSIRFDSDLLENSANGFETLVKMGEKIGTPWHP